MRARISAVAVAAAALVLSGALVAGATRDAGATAAPVEMNFACALKSNGLMRYVTNLNQCKNSEE